MQETLLLGWDFGHMKDESKLSITSHDTDLILSPSPTLMLHNTVDSKWLWLSSCPFYQSNITSSSSNYNFDDSNLAVKPHSFPLTLSNIPNYHDLAKNYNCGISGKEDTSFQPRLNQCSFIGEIFKETCFPKLEAHILPSKFDFDIGNVPNKLLITPLNWKHHSALCQALQFPSKEAICSDILIEDNSFETYKGTSCYRETINHFQENVVNVDGCSSFCFQASIDQEKEWPSLLDKSSWDEKEAEIFYSPNEGDYIWWFSCKPFHPSKKKQYISSFSFSPVVNYPQWWLILTGILCIRNSFYEIIVVISESSLTDWYNDWFWESEIMVHA